MFASVNWQHIDCIIFDLSIEILNTVTMGGLTRVEE